MKIYFLIYGIILYSIILSSCFCFIDNEKEKGEEDNYPIYKAKVVWKSNVKTTSKLYGAQENEYLYLYDNSEGFYRVVKLDCETGITKWRSSEYIPTPRTLSPVIIGDKLFLMTESRSIYAIDKGSGKILAIIKVDSNSFFEDYFLANGNYLYFGLEDYTDPKLNKKINCLARLDINNINFSGTMEEQVISLEMIWYSKEYNNKISYSPIIEDDVIYFFTTRVLVAVGLENCELKWEKPVADNNEGYGILAINNDTVYMLRKNIGAFRNSDGEKIIFKHLEDNGPRLTMGSVIFDKKIFYTNGNFNNSGGRTKGSNIVCINANDGSVLWSRLDYETFSMGVVPVINNNKLYLPLERGINVIDAQTGEFLGLDKNFYSHGLFTKIYLYKNFLIFANSEDANPNAQSHVNYRYIAIDISE